MSRKIYSRTFIGALLATLVGASSCSSEPSSWVYEYHPVPIENWSKTDTVVIDLPEIGQTGLCRTQVGVRTNINFPYRNIWLGVCQTLHHPDTVFLDTVACPVMLRSDLGKNGISLFLTEATLPERVYQAGQSGIIKIFHILRREEVPGVCQVGIQIQPAERP